MENGLDATVNKLVSVCKSSVQDLDIRLIIIIEPRLNFSGF